MPRVLGGTSEPSPPEPNEAEVAVQINVPQEFAGMSMGELHTRGGQVKGMDVLSNDVLIRASVPESEFDALKKGIDAGTQHRGRVERAGQ
jgi:translation elongation factor EF-G